MENISVYEMVNNIVQVVFYTHFSYITDQELKKDLWQIGYLKAYELLNNGNYDPTMSLRNFIYTGVRNEMHNTLYHLGKIPTVSLSDLDVYENVVGYNQVRDYYVDDSVVEEISERFKKHGDFYSFLLGYLTYLGLIDNKYLRECLLKKYSSYNYELTLNETQFSMLDSLKALTLWKLYEKEEING